MAQGNDDLNMPILNLSPQEKSAYSYLFGLADGDSLNIVTGERAVSFFERTNVPEAVLGEAWQIADTENRGFLTKPGFCMVLRLIGWYQNGQNQPSTELAFKPGPLPRFENITLPGPTTSPTVASFPQGALQPQLSGQNTGSGPIRVPPLDPNRAQQYAGLFSRSGVQNGLLAGSTAKSIFEKAGLPNETLGKIWMLSDREQRGALDETEFIIAMHLLSSTKNRAMASLPNALPQGLYEAAARRGQPLPSRQNSAHVAAVPRQLTGSGVNTAPRTQSPLARPASSSYSTPPQSAQATGPHWLVTQQEKAQYDQFFNRIDTSGSGLVSGEQAVAFFSDSRLPEEVLASIWDLADINSEGQLNKDEFAVAMYYIRQQRAPNAPPLPFFLPPALIPPSMRGTQPVQQAQSAFQPPPPTEAAAQPPVVHKSAADDLFELDSPGQAQAPLQPQGTGASATRDPFGGSAQGSPASPSRFQTQSPAAGTFKPFVPTSAFGTSLAAQTTGGSAVSAQGQQQQQQQQQQRGPPAPMPSTIDDLLGENEANTQESRSITNDSTELANMSNQIGNLRTQMESTQTRKAATQADLNATSAQKKDLEQRLQQFRGQYEAEVRAVKEMEQQLTASRESTSKLKQELAMIEGTHQDLQTQHNTISQQLQADQQENASLKQKIAQINSEVSRLKPELEKMKLDARQQKGLVSINKKQLATNEAERDRVLSDKADLESAAAEQSRNITASAEPAAAIADGTTASPAPSTMSSTNPFFRKLSSDGQGSPAISGPNPSAFDAIFGPSSAFAPTGQASDRSGTPPATSFIGRSMPSAGAAVAAGVGATVVAAAAVGGVALADSMSSAGEPTPSATPPLSETNKDSPLASTDPPPPPEGGQFTPMNLPLHDNITGADGKTESDVASSTQVIPPASQAGGFETPRDFASSPLPTFGSVTGASSAFPPPPTRSEEPQREIIPGAFPAEERRPSIIAQEVVPSNGPSSENVTPAPQPKAADEFESAFANFGEGEQAKEGGAGYDPFAPSSSQQAKTVDNEFPPIQDLEQDDDSDSDYDGERGFGDEFTTTSAPQNGAFAASTVFGGVSGAAAGSLPDTSTVSAPPTYEQIGGSHQVVSSGPSGNHDFPGEFRDLLPAREDPTSPPPPPENQLAAGPPDTSTHDVLPVGAQSPSQTVSSSTDTFVDASSRPLSSVPDLTPFTQTSAAPVAQRNVFDEFDDFNDLSEANEGDKSANDLDFAFGRQSHDEFNPAFDSPAESQTPTPMKAVPVAAESNGFANFTPNASAGGPGAFGSSPSSIQRTPQDAQNDWDAIFSGFDSGKNLDTSFGNSNSDEIWQPPPGPPPGRAPITTNGNSATLAAPASLATSSAKQTLPPLGRAITPGTEHDDPILKRLTGMGYPRAEALNALEKYDYDINKAVDHLTGA